MGRRCTVCTHPQRADLDWRIVSGEAYRVISRQTGLRHDALRRHAEHHIPATIRAAHADRQRALGVSLAQRTDALMERALDALTRAELDGSHKAVAAAHRTVQGYLLLWGRATGQIAPDHAPPSDGNAVAARMQRQAALAAVAGRFLELLGSARAPVIEATPLPPPEEPQEPAQRPQEHAEPALVPVPPRPPPAAPTALQAPEEAPAVPPPPAPPAQRPAGRARPTPRTNSGLLNALDEMPHNDALLRRR